MLRTPEEAKVRCDVRDPLFWDTNEGFAFDFDRAADDFDGDADWERIEALGFAALFDFTVDAGLGAVLGFATAFVFFADCGAEDFAESFELFGLAFTLGFDAALVDEDFAFLGAAVFTEGRLNAAADGRVLPATVFASSNETIFACATNGTVPLSASWFVCGVFNARS